jgi:hypothetical protein
MSPLFHTGPFKSGLTRPHSKGLPVRTLVSLQGFPFPLRGVNLSYPRFNEDDMSPLRYTGLFESGLTRPHSKGIPVRSLWIINL